jgi:hypothetical protein
VASTPRARWEASVAAVPLETPRPLPAAFHTLAHAITGRSHAPRYTTGAATRRALSAAGALGATTGSVIHLSAPPTGGPAVAAVLAHELTHVRSPVRRPRFFLGGAAGLLDDDERGALAAGRSMLTGAANDALGTAASQAAGTVSAGIVDQLPVGTGVGNVGELAARAARAAVIEATAAVPGFAALQSAADAVPGALGFPSAVAPAAASQATAAAEPGAVSLVESPVAPGAGGGPGSAGAATAPAVDPDRIVEIVEERLLREMERRGGRWAGVF